LVTAILLGLPLGVVSIVAVLVSKRWVTFSIVSVCVALAFVALWISSNSPVCDPTDTEIGLRMCQQSRQVGDAFRMLVVGVPALAVFIVAYFKLTQLAR
jgi:hypothetical protein